VARQIGKEPIIAQRYVPEAGRGDIRALVIDGEVVASLWRTPKEGNVASNFHSGGQPSRHNLTEEERVQAVKAAKSMGLAVSGVDIVPTENGPLVFEANSLPDFMHMREVAGVDPIPALAAALRKAAESG
jgi:ribosomal protein S6--L-glutamate ligase